MPRQDARGVYSSSTYANRSPLTTSAIPRPAAAYQADISEVPAQDQGETPEHEQGDAQGNYANEPSSFDYDYEDEPANQYFVAPIAEAKPFVCKVCSEAFPSKNRLHYHLDSRGLGRTQAKKTCSGRSAMHAWNKQQESENDSKSINIQLDSRSSPDETNIHLNDTPSEEANPIIESNADSSKDIGTGQAYRGWRYAQVKTQLKPDGVVNMVCADSGTSITMMDRKLKERDLPDAHTHLMAVPARVRGIGNDIHETNEYIIHEIYLPDGKDTDGRVVTAKTARREIHLVDGLAAGMLLGNDILVPEGIDLLFLKGTAHIDSCDVDIPIEVRSKGPLMRRVINSKEASIIPPHSNATVAIHHLDLPNRDFLFEPREDSVLSLYAGMINKNTEAIPVKNDSNKPVKIQRNMKLGDLSDLTIDGCYHVTFG